MEGAKASQKRTIASVFGLVLVLAAVSLVLALTVGSGRATTHKLPPVIGGKKAPVSVTAPLAVVSDLRAASAAGCTGTLVSSRLVLTAGHCLENAVTGRSRSPVGFRVSVRGSHHGLAKPTILRASRILVFPGFSFTDDAHPDAGLIVLAHPAPGPVQATATGSDFAQIHGGAPATLVGWVPSRRSGRRILLAVEASTVLQHSPVCERDAEVFQAKIDYCVLDPPSYKTGVCHGDSGGPLIVHTATGDSLEIGIAVKGAPSCSTKAPSVFTRLSVIAPWLEAWIARYR
jgi:Trypsin